ncbi:MAG: hypothetical protein IJA43_08125 [Clostridia bacterium]|nr:hypothetical protein [Clostridia bacterium]
MDVKSEKGAIIVEATLSLTFFMFAIITVYTMFNVALAQSRISSALNLAAKEISQYAYIYDMTGLNDKQAEIAANSGAAQAILQSDLSDIENFYDAVSGITDSALTIATDSGNAESFLYYVLNDGIDRIKGGLLGEVAQVLMKKNFGSNPDAFLKGLRVKDGFDGLNFSDSKFFSNGEDPAIVLNVRYEIVVVKFFDFEMTMEFELCAQTRAWVGE